MPILCPQCHSAASLAFTTKDYNRRITDETFSYYQCPNCGLIFQWPIVADLGKFYTDLYYRVPKTVEELLPRTAPEQYKVDMIKKYKSGGKLLDIGPSIGLFVYLAKQAGYDTEVIEMDKACCEFIESQLKIKAYNSSDIETALSQLGTYDIISMWQVIEHVPNPWELLPLLVEHLNPGGILILAAPNPNSLQFRLFKSHWVHVDAPRHVELIPYELLSKVVQSYGSKLLLQTTSDDASWIHNRYGFLYSMAGFSTNSRIRTLLKILGFGLYKLLSPIENRDMNGCCYTLFFQKA